MYLSVFSPSCLLRTGQQNVCWNIEFYLSYRGGHVLTLCECVIAFQTIRSLHVVTAVLSLYPIVHWCTIICARMFCELVLRLVFVALICGIHNCSIFGNSQFRVSWFQSYSFLMLVLWSMKAIKIQLSLCMHKVLMYTKKLAVFLCTKWMQCNSYHSFEKNSWWWCVLKHTAGGGVFWNTHTVARHCWQPTCLP